MNESPTEGKMASFLIGVMKMSCELKSQIKLIIEKYNNPSESLIAILQEVQAICDRVVIINNGKIAAIDTPDNLAKTISNENKFSLRISGDERSILDVLESISGIKSIKSLGRKERNSIDFIIEAEPDVDVRPEIFTKMANNNLPILSMQTVDMSLEDIFISLTNKSSSATKKIKETR